MLRLAQAVESTGVSVDAAKTVLVVDDERLLRWSLARRLTIEGYRVLEAGTAQEALRLAGGDVNLVLLDLKLPDGDGLAVLDTLRSSAPECRVIMMSAYATPERVTDAYERGVNHFATKPFDLDEMMRRVDSVLEAPERPSDAPSAALEDPRP